MTIRYFLVCFIFIAAFDPEEVIVGEQQLITLRYSPLMSGKYWCMISRWLLTMCIVYTGGFNPQESGTRELYY